MKKRTAVRLLSALLSLALMMAGIVSASAEAESASSAETAVWQELFARKDYSEALPLVRKAADSGDPEAMAALAYMMIFEEGTEKDTAGGYELARRAVEAEGGAQNDLAMLLLGFCYDVGDPVETDYAAAMEWYQKAAALGNGEAMARIGRIYMYGRGTAVEEETGLDWYRRAVENNGPTAYLYRGYAYSDGLGVEKNLHTALENYLKAFEEGNRNTRKNAARNIAILYLSSEWDQADDAGAEEWAEKAMEEGDADVWYYLGKAALSGEDESSCEKAKAIYDKGIASGSLLSLYGKGLMYVYGQGVEIDYAKAKEFFEQAIAEGCADAYDGLADLYLYGRGVPQDNETAIACAQRVLENKDSSFTLSAMQTIAFAYTNMQEYEKSMEWLKRAAETENSGIPYENIGRRYYLGIGVKKNYEEALYWFNKAAERRITGWLGKCYLYGHGVEKDYGKAMELFLQNLESDVVIAGTNANPAIWYIGYMYREGLGVTQDYAAALEWFEKGAGGGDPYCMTSAADLYRDGKGTEKNMDKAFELYEQAARKDSATAYEDLGELYRTGKEVPQDFQKAIAYYEKGAALGSSYCYGQIGWIYAYGMNPADYAKAIEYYEKGAELDYAYCLERLGSFYANGTGVAADPEKAAAYYYRAVEKAGEQDDPRRQGYALDGLRNLKRTVDKVTVREKKVSLLVGASPEQAQVQLSCTVAPENALWKDVIWISSDEEIATVDENGVVTAVAPGKAVISAATTQPQPRAKPAQVSVTVGQAVTGIELDSSAVTIPVKKKTAVRANVTPAEASVTKLSWSSENEGIAAVNGSGQITGKSAGTTTVTAEATDGSGVSASVQVTVVQPVKKIGLDEKNVILAPGTFWQMSFRALPEDATDQTVLWNSDTETVAAVDESGRITAVGAGSCTVTGTAADGSKAQAQIRVTVKEFDVVLSGREGVSEPAALFDGLLTVTGFRISGDFDESKVKFKNGCAALENGTLIPRKAGEDSVTVSFRADGKTVKRTFSLYVAQDAAAAQ